MIEISKELLSEVLKCKVIKINGMLENVANQNILSYELNDTSLNDGKRLINIYELAHKCKEWAFDNGYYLTIYNDAIDVVLQTSCNGCKHLEKKEKNLQFECLIEICRTCSRNNNDNFEKKDSE